MYPLVVVENAATVGVTKQILVVGDEWSCFGFVCD